MKKIYIFIIIAAFSKHGFGQLQPHFSFYNLHQSIINPAAMSTYEQINGAFIYNAQMVGFNGAPMTGMFDIGIPIGKTNATVGGQLIHESIGVNSRSLISGSFAYRVPINLRNYLSFGMNVSAEIIQTNYHSLSNVDPNDPTLSVEARTFALPNFRLGAYYFRDNFYAGFAVGNIFNSRLENNEYRIGVDASDMHFYLNAGYQVRFADVWKFQPSVLLKQVSGSPLQADINCQFSFRDFLGFGLSYRTLSTVVAQVNFTIRKTVLLGYAYNYGFGRVSRADFMGHEVILTFRAPSTAKKRIGVDVPRF